MPVLDPTDYVIRTRFDVQGNVPGLDRVHTQITRIEGLIGGLGGSITRGIVGAFAAAAGVAGIGGLVKSVVSLNTEIQNAEFGIASLYSAMGKMPMNSALSLARDTVKELRREAAAGVGDFSDYLGGFNVIAGPAMAAGASQKQVLEINRLAIAAGAASGRGPEGMRLAQMDVVQGLNGRAGVQTQILNQALGNAGISDKQFNAMSGQAKIDALLKGLGTYKAAADAFGQTWDAKISTFRDSVKDIGREVTKPLFDQWTSDLGQVNTWLEKNRAILDDMANNAGRRLLGIWREISNNPGAIGAAGVGLGGALAGGRVAGLAASAVGATGGTGALAIGFGAAIVGFISAAVGAAISKLPELGARLSAHLGLFGDEFGKLAMNIVKLFSNPWMVDFGNAFGLFGDVLIKVGIVVVRMLSALTEQFKIFFEATHAASEGFIALGSGDRAGAQALFRRSSDLNRAGGMNFKYQMEHLLDFNGSKKIPGETEKPPVTEPPVINLNGPISIKIEAERLDDPNLVATTFEAVMKRLQEYPRHSRGRGYVPKPN